MSQSRGSRKGSAELLEEIATRVEVLSHAAFSSDGQVTRLPDTTSAGDRHLTRTLTDHLYHRFYLGIVRGLTSESGSDDPREDRRPIFARGDADLVRRAREACGERYTWTSGWRVEHDDSRGASQVSKDGLHLRCHPAELRVDAEGLASVRFPAERPFVSPGFYLVNGEAGSPDSHESVARLYLSVDVCGVVDLFSRIVRVLDARGVPFVAKMLNAASLYTRPDSIVLYLQRDQATDVLPELIDVVSSSAYLRATTPAFTRELAPGLAIADEPEGQVGLTSFGRHRCGLIARGLVSALAQPSAPLRHVAVLQRLREAGIRVDAMHLNPGAPEFAFAWGGA